MMAASRKKKTPRTLSEKQKAVLREHAVRPGQVLNKEGANGWDDTRRRVRDVLALSAEDLAAKLIELAEAGDIQALKLALGPLLPRQQHEVEHLGRVEFRWADPGKADD